MEKSIRMSIDTAHLKVRLSPALGREDHGASDRPLAIPRPLRPAGSIYGVRSDDTGVIGCSESTDPPV
jgi:hypothetical protein